MIISSFLDHDKYGGYFAFLFTCVIVMYEKLENLHIAESILLATILLLCGGTLYIENTGFFVLLVIFYIQVIKCYFVRNLAHP